MQDAMQEHSDDDDDDDSDWVMERDLAGSEEEMQPETDETSESDFELEQTIR
jgi:hypothetical protein